MDTYDDILLRMKNNYKEITGFNADDVADIGIRLKVLASEIYSCQSYSNWLQAQVFPSTATGQSLDLHAQSRGLQRKDGQVANGEITFSVNEPANEIIHIPIGTICSTSSDPPIFFETISEAAIGETRTYTTVEAVSRDIGSQNNVAPNTINTMVIPVTGIDSINNQYSFTDGLDIESDEDLRSRIINNYVNTITGTNKAYYIQEAEKTDGVYSATVVPKGRGTGTVDVYICGKGRVCSDEEVQDVQNRLEVAREVNVDVLTFKAEILQVGVQVSISVVDGYDIYSVRNECKENISAFFDELQVGQSLMISELYEAINKTNGLKYFNLLEPTQRINPNIDTKLWLKNVDIYFESE